MRLAIMFWLIFSCLINSDLQSQCKIYVNAEATLPPDGNSWESAYTDLEQAIEVARVATCGIPEVWVAEGSYVPSIDKDLNGALDDRFNTFFIDYDIKLYGGFAGWETSLTQRDHYNNRTYLSGDLDGDDVVSHDTLLHNEENVYTVLRLEDLSDDSEISGFYIRGGNSNKVGSGFSVDRRGGAMWTDDTGTPFEANISDCIFEYNEAKDHGGAIYNRGSGGEVSPRIERCIFRYNRVGGHGGAMLNNGFGAGSKSSPFIRNCLFHNNTAGLSGGVIYADGSGGGQSDMKIEFSTFANNSCQDKGGAIRYNNPTSTEVNHIANSIFWNNNAGSLSDGNDIYFTISSPSKITFYANIISEGGVIGDVNDNFNISSDPLFVANTVFNKNFRLQALSPAMDKLSTLTGSGVDLDNNNRIFGTRADAGCYEFMPCTSDRNIYVNRHKKNVPGDGSSWTEPHKDLTMAILQAHNCDDTVTVHVTEGIYTPTRGRLGEIVSTPAYHISNMNINLLGGYDDILHSNDRNPDENPTILSGDRKRNDSINTETGQFVNYDDNTQLLDASRSHLNSDGFVIRNSKSIALKYVASSGLIHNSIFLNNAIAIYFGASQSTHKSLWVENSLIQGNDRGIVLSRSGDDPRTSIPIHVEGSIFNHNISEAIKIRGNLISFITSITNCTFTDNGGSCSMDFSNQLNLFPETYISNSIIYNSPLTYSAVLESRGLLLVQSSVIEESECQSFGTLFTCDQLSNIFDNPLFRPHGRLGELLINSPAINQGLSNNNLRAKKDIYGNPRIINGVDIGAIEHTGPCQDILKINSTTYPGMNELSGLWTADQLIEVDGSYLTPSNHSLSLCAPEVDIIPSLTLENGSTMNIVNNICSSGSDSNRTGN